MTRQGIDVDLATRQALLAGTRDVAVQRLRDMTLAIGVGAAGAVGLAAYIAAATIPGVSDASASEQASAQAGTADIPSQVTAPSGTSTDRQPLSRPQWCRRHPGTTSQ